MDNFKKALLVIFTLQFANAYAEVNFDITGMKIGDQLTEEFRYSNCPAKDKGKPEVTCSRFIELGGGRVFVSYYFDEFKLIGAALSFKPDLFNDVLAAYTQKFDEEPESIKEEEVVTRAGVTYLNQIVAWETTSGKFEVSKYGSSISHGSAVIHSPEFVNYTKKKRAERQKELADKL
ncbi:TPA: hypothetical protein I7789_RS22095 [Vibrio parahaemolyticus]|nr:hypothetical protein [Vibrio parahaemolyticus]